MIDFAVDARNLYPEVLSNDRLVSELTDVKAVAVSPSVNVGYTYLNRHLTGEKSAIVAMNGFMSDVTTPDIAYTGAQLASLGRPVLMLDIPGHGFSTPHNTKQIIDLCFKRKADSEAAPIQEAIQRLLNPNDSIDYFGISHGGLLVTKSAELDPNDRVDNIFVLDMPGVKRRTSLGLQIGYMLFDNILGRRKTLEALKNAGAVEEFEEFKAAYSELDVTRADSFVENNTGLFLLNLFASINARPVALDSLQKILAEKSTVVSLATSEHGHTTDHRAIQSFIDELPEEQRQKIFQEVILGEDHNAGITYLAPRAVTLANKAFTR
jgi:pimeloyl-ACP methyl ester carboxylesterase